MKFIFFTLLTLFSSTTVLAKDLIIENAEIRVLPTKNTTAATMKITNNSKINYKLIKVEGNFAKTFELHTMGKVDGMMKMRKIDSIDVLANTAIELKSGGLHLMIFDLNDFLKENTEYEMKLHFEPKKIMSVRFKAVGL